MKLIRNRPLGSGLEHLQWMFEVDPRFPDARTYQGEYFQMAEIPPLDWSECEMEDYPASSTFRLYTYRKHRIIFDGRMFWFWAPLGES